MSLNDGRCPPESLLRATLDKHGQSIARHLLSDGLAIGIRPSEFHIGDLVRVPHPVYSGPLSTVTVAVCTRDRTADLKRCLDSLTLVNYPGLEIVVVDNAPSDESTERLVHDYPYIRYVREPRPGLDWARNRAILEARGEIIAYTDDDVVVDPTWVFSLAAVFAQEPDAMAVTGLVVPYELETEAQVQFEETGGFGRGFRRKWYRANARRIVKSQDCTVEQEKSGPALTWRTVGTCSIISVFLIRPWTWAHPRMEVAILICSFASLRKDTPWFMSRAPWFVTYTGVVLKRCGAKCSPGGQGFLHT
jgi:glycosyltransferase involved in cell wall biosynthesis